MTLLLYVALLTQVLGWVRTESLQSTNGPVAPSAVSVGLNTNLKPMLPIIIASALGGFFGFLLIVFAILYLLRRRRSKDVDNVVESAHFPTVGYHSNYPTASPPISTNSREHKSYVGYSHWEKPEESPPVPPGLPVPAFRS